MKAVGWLAAIAETIGVRMKNHQPFQNNITLVLPFLKYFIAILSIDARLAQPTHSMIPARQREKRVSLSLRCFVGNKDALKDKHPRRILR